MTTSQKQDFANLANFKKQNQLEDGGFSSIELATEYASIYMKAWGSNLVFLGIDEKGGIFYAGFNVFD